MTVDDLVMQGARTSTARILTQSAWNIPVPVPVVLKYPTPHALITVELSLCQTVELPLFNEHLY